MTNEQRGSIILFRSRGCCYSEIAKAIGVSKETVKTFCRRNNLGDQDIQRIQGTDKSICPQCKKPLDGFSRTKPRRFCTTQCRKKWWYAQHSNMRSNAIYHFTCAGCGKQFFAYGNNHRKYCSHECYILTRFGKEASI